MPIAFKSKLSSAVANATFLDKTIDDIKKGKLALYKVSVVETGYISDMQAYANELADTMGQVNEGDPNRKEYASVYFIASGDNRKEAIEKLDTQLKAQFDTLVDHEERIVVLETKVTEVFGNQVEATIANNQAAPADVTGMTLDNSLYTSAEWKVELYRHTDSVHAFANGTVYLQKVNGAWRVRASGFEGDPDAAAFEGGGINFSVVMAGLNPQVQYVTNTIAGAGYVGIMKLRRMVFNVVP
jgi:hypothetical protein